jgi:hypothetical protein
MGESNGTHFPSRQIKYRVTGVNQPNGYRGNQAPGYRSNPRGVSALVMAAQGPVRAIVFRSCFGSFGRGYRVKPGGK